MASCCGSAGCSCKIEAADLNITVTGNGSTGNPFQIGLANDFPIPTDLDEATALLVAGPSATNLAMKVREAIWYVDDFGAIGDGATDDRDAVQDAIDTADAAGGGMVMMGKGKFYACSGLITVKNAVYLLGNATRQNLPPGDPPTVPGLVAYDDTFQFRIGDWATDVAPGGVSCVYVDGNNVGGDPGLTKQGLVRVAGVDIQIDRLFAVRGAGDGIVYDATQNSTIHGGGSTFHQGKAFVLDNGPGALSFHGGYYGTSQNGVIEFRDTPGETSLYPFGPVQCNWFGTIFESYDVAPFSSPQGTFAHYKCGQNNNFYGCNFTGGADSAANANTLVDNTDSLIATIVRFDGCTWWTYPGHDKIRIVGNQQVNETGVQFISDNGASHAVSVFCIDGGIPHISAEGENVRHATTPMYRTISGGSALQCFTRHEGGQINIMNVEQVFGFRRDTDDGHRMYVDQDGSLVWYDGTLASPVKGYLGRGTDTGVYVDGGQLDIRAGVTTAGPVDNPAAPWVYPGGVSSQDFDAALFRNWRAVWLAGGTTTFTFSNPVAGRELNLMLYAAFGTTPVVTWPGAIIWGPSGVPPLTVGTLTSVTFRWDETFSQWHEVSRSG